MGAGKTTVVSLITAMKKTYVISADEIGHQLLLKENQGYHLVVQAFGKAVLSDDGEIVRSKLGQMVFEDKAKLQLLNEIMHPLIYKEVKRQVDAYKMGSQLELVIIDAALLIEIGLTRLTDYIIAVYADDEVRIQRIMQRQGLTRKQTTERFKVQKKWEEFMNIADYVIHNNLSIEDTKAQIKNLISCI